MSGPRAPAEDLTTRETLRVFARALRYTAPFRARFALKGVLVLLSLVPFLLLPWPAKILIDHVVEGLPLAASLAEYPLFLRPLLRGMVGLPPGQVLLWTLAGTALLVLLVGAMGTSGRERDQTDATLASGHDSATRTENQANAGFSLAGGVLGLVDFHWTMRLTQDLNHHYRSRLFERIQSLPMTAFDDERIGDALFRVMYDTPSLTPACYRILLTPVVAPIAIVATALVLRHVFGEHPFLFWAALAALPGALIVTFPFAAPIRRAAERSRRAGATTTTTVEEGIANVLAVQSLGGTARERRRFARDSWNAFGSYRGLLVAALATALVALIPALLGIRWVFLYVADLVIGGAISKGSFLVLVGYFLQIATYAVLLGSLWILIQESAAGLQRVFLLMDLPAERDPAHARPAPPIRQGLELDDVHVRYPDGTHALRGVSLEARLGELVALVGPAGAGKTTLASLIPRFVEPERGRVRADGWDTTDVTRESLRAQVAFVFQENVLFDATVAENIRAGDLRASDAEVERAARRAGAHEFIRRLPQGYRTRLGRAGARLSVGQKQRLAIARALVRDAAVLILDEPTSALDPETERALLQTLREAATSRIVLVIAHRLSTVQIADRIVFLEGGRIVEQGSPAELLARPGGAYRRFVELQTRGAA